MPKKREISGIAEVSRARATEATVAARLVEFAVARAGPTAVSSDQPPSAPYISAVAMGGDHESPPSWGRALVLHLPFGA